MKFTKRELLLLREAILALDSETRVKLGKILSNSMVYMSREEVEAGNLGLKLVKLNKLYDKLNERKDKNV